jgi:hypothetical protein
MSGLDALLLVGLHRASDFAMKVCAQSKCVETQLHAAAMEAAKRDGLPLTAASVWELRQAIGLRRGHVRERRVEAHSKHCRPHERVQHMVESTLASRKDSHF